ncbi:bifunctional glycosyltransferase/CDP-glycerol:glycerophosphate glycerophosphotransferase [Streptomyces sp. CMB-StM0423]|uniref:bifunctional glycosyltransferase/CDP-glycerol:glycerophosphate glycerophosphotransferase n=1 Tax=Streptomyces sp. CMB-StM0423 TaxID=2059884 RepID=UPI000C7123D1|nr:bifunctional glycosyltransferase/CDP-glycerol:glycerophosphate glycerophosphotransferase [Streptomyces sp. CMB-StM0423]AUH42735.1 glycosyl transferase [Streptomyces sp. CMB-StM0423]
MSVPRFSVIVPAYRVQAYLDECLESVLTQSFTDVEVIAVDDRSPDFCGEIIDAAAARDPRLTAVHLSANVGLGRARNAGLERATGDYVLFLDGDDTLVPGALQAIADRLAATAAPDVLVYDYARAYWDGRHARNVRADLLAERDPQVFRLAERPELLRLLMVVWNKAYRRDFVAAQGLSFPPGYYEDTPWTYPALLSAERIAVLDRVCVHYRQRRSGNILGTPGEQHLDVFEQYDRVFAFLAARRLERWRPVLFVRMVDHLTTIFNKGERVPRHKRAEFFRRARALYVRYGAAAGAEDGVRARGDAGGAVRAGHGVRARTRHLLVRLGTRRAFQLLGATGRLLSRTRDLAARAVRRARAGCGLLYYRLQLRLPLDPHLAVFAAYWYRGYSCNPAALEARARELVPGLATAWIARPAYAHTVPPGVRVLRPGSRACHRALARATYLVNNVNFPQDVVKRRGQIHVQTHHGTPLKKMGLDLADHPAGAAGMDFAALMTRVDRWDYSLSANRHSTLAWSRAYPAEHTTLEYGYPRNDALAGPPLAPSARAGLRARLGIPEGATAVLYAPTHRDYLPGHVPALDLGALARALRERGAHVVLLARAHYFHDAAPAGAPPAGVLDVTAHPSLTELCLASDALLTDYSSVMFDYALLGRPIVIHAADWEAYRLARGTYFDLTAEPPGRVCRTAGEIADAFATGAHAAPAAAAQLAAFRRRFCPYDDGHAAERVVRHVFLGEAGRPPVPGPGGVARGVPGVLPRPAGSAVVRSE